MSRNVTPAGCFFSLLGRGSETHNLGRLACWALILLIGFTLLPQSEKRRNQIRRLLEQSDLVVVASATDYNPVIDSVKYRRERDRGSAEDPSRVSQYMLGVVYHVSVRETVYRKKSADERDVVSPQSGDPLVVYVPGPLADPREFGKISLQPGGEYLLFLRKADINPEEFRTAVEQVSGVAMMEWRAFPDTRVIYFTPIRDSFAALLIEGAWVNFLAETRRVAQQMPSRQ